ncbi:MAG: hypothetical protein GY811_27290 [Myxococcales bacterium]|nr:hypothetical protein [Myxococcales bacterium]
MIGARNDRWQAFAQAIAAALGINLWISLVLAPGLAVGAIGSQSPSPMLAILALILPLPLLVLGIRLRNETILLFAFPSTLLVPIALFPTIASQQVYSPVRTAIVGVGLVAFLVGASTLTSFREPPAPKSRRPLKSSLGPVPPRWRRRNRLYAMLAILSLVYPLVLLYHINFDKAGAVALGEKYPGRAATFTTLLNILTIATWLVLLEQFFLSPLEGHRRGDKVLRRELSGLRSRATRQGPRLAFYLCGLSALVLMALWFVWHR